MVSYQSRAVSARTGLKRAKRMRTVEIVRWQEDEAWIGYLQDYPDYWTQGVSLDDLREHLRDLYQDLTSGELPGIRKIEELVVP